MMTMAVVAANEKTTPAYILGGQIADSARIAERTPDAGDLRQQAVTTAAQRVITVSGLKPTVVQTALETVLAECPVKLKSDTAGTRGYLCPATEEAHVAIERLLVVVRRLASLELSPGAGEGNGIGDLGSPPGGGGGADYRSIPTP
jgi:hypothetical protein